VIATLALGVPSSAHFIFIPVVLILGVVFGFIMGSKATRDAYALEEKKAAERLERAAKRAARQAASAADSPPGGTSTGGGA
jgi:arginine exporter protein ArgO